MSEGPNLVTNGDFPVSVAGWTVSVIGAGSFTHDSGGGGRGVLTGFTNPTTSPGVSLIVSQAISVTAMTDYKFTFDIKQANSGSLAGAGNIGLSAGSSEHGSLPTTSTGVKTQSFTTGAETTVYVSFGLGGADFEIARGDSFKIDDVSLKEQLSAVFKPRISIIS